MSGTDRHSLGLALLQAATRELTRLRRVRGAYRRTARQIARAAAMLALAEALLGITAPPRAEAAAVFVTEQLPFGITDLVDSLATPAFADIDADGDLDVFIGQKDGNTLFFRNTGTFGAPAFAAASTNPFGITDVGGDSRPAFADIDGDGDLDGLFGAANGTIRFFRNTGSANAPAFAAPSDNPFGLADVGLWSAPTFVNLDGDGDLDAFVGESDGNTLFFQNTGTSTAPAFAAPSTNPFGLAGVGVRARPTFANIDGDGDLDAFVGDTNGNTLFFRNTGSSSALALEADQEEPIRLVRREGEAQPGIGEPRQEMAGDSDFERGVGHTVGMHCYQGRATGGAVQRAITTIACSRSPCASDVSVRA